MRAIDEDDAPMRTIAMAVGVHCNNFHENWFNGNCCREDSKGAMQTVDMTMVAMELVTMKT